MIFSRPYALALKVTAVLLYASLVLSSTFPKRSELCDQWANVDNECVNNPGYMWTSCLDSCVKFSRDDDGPNCARWAAEGECTNNPRYVQVHCPRSCGMSLLWSPWARRAVGLSDVSAVNDKYTTSVVSDACAGQASDVLSTALIEHMRLRAFMAGHFAHQVPASANLPSSDGVPGLATSSPTEYLGMLGIAEAFLYTMRLYEVVLRGSTGSQQPPNLVNQRESALQAVLVGIRDITNLLSKGYASDPIMRKLPDMMEALEECLKQTQQYLTHLAGGDFDMCDSAHTHGVSPHMNQIVQQLQLPVGADTQSKALQLLTRQLNSHGAPTTTTVQMPIMGLGTWQLTGQRCIDAVYDAIRIGYRSIDTAQAYRNEAEVGEAISRALNDKIVRREDLFIATKLSDEGDGGYAKVQRLVHQQLRDLRVDYLDLYMLHSPMHDSTKQGETWKALEMLVAEGKIRALGVSNFDSNQLRALYESVNIKPAVVQNKLDVYHVGKQLDNRGDPVVRYAQAQGILIVGYSPFSAYPFVMKPADDPIVGYVAAQHTRRQLLRGNRDGTLSDSLDATSGVLHSSDESSLAVPTTKTAATTPGQVLLRWAIQKGFAVIPRSADETRMAENFAALVMPPLTDDEMAVLDSLQHLISSPVCVPTQA